MGLEPTTFCMASRRSSQLSYIRVGGQYSPAVPGRLPLAPGGAGLRGRLTTLASGSGTLAARSY
jgi:hypothetical protein